jgi:uncharacterized protein with HEPN domain
MHPKSPKLLDDVSRSCQFIADDTAGETLETYLRDRRLRRAVERNLEIVGEALVRLRTVEPDTAAQITGLHRIIGLRNRLAHDYDEEIDDTLVWRAVQDSVPALHAEAKLLLPEFEQ